MKKTIKGGRLRVAKLKEEDHEEVDNQD